MVAVVAAGVAHYIAVSELRETHSDVTSEAVTDLGLRPVALSVVSIDTGALPVLYFTCRCGENGERSNRMKLVCSIAGDERYLRRVEVTIDVIVESELVHSSNSRKIS